MAMPPNLLDLPDHVLLGHVCVDSALGGRDLAALEAVSRRFRLKSAELSSGGGACTMATFTARTGAAPSFA